MTRSFVFALLAFAAPSGLGCHSTTEPKAANPHTVDPLTPREVLSVSGSTTELSSDPHAAASPQPSPIGPNPTPSKTVSTSPPSTSSPPTVTEPYRPTDKAPEPPKGIGGGPKSDTGGAVFGDGNEGNTGAIKGGDTPPPSDPKSR